MGEASNSIVILTPNPAPVVAQWAPLVERATALTVTSKDCHGDALEVLRRLRLAQKAIKDLFADSKTKAHTAHKSIVRTETTLLQPYKEAERIVGKKCDGWEAEQRRIAQEQQRRIEEEARKREEDRQLQEAIEAEEAGETDEAEAILERPVAAPIVHVETQVAKVDGISSSAKWHAEVKDFAALVRYVAEHPEWLQLIQPNTVALNGLARSQRAELNIPGVVAAQETVRAVRA